MAIYAWCIMQIPNPLKKIKMPVNSDFINVKTMGAAGDGITDDSVAIQNALNATTAVNVGTYQGPVGITSPQTVYFPSGLYRISQPIIMPATCTLKGDNAVLISFNNNVTNPTTATFNAFEFPDTYDVCIEGIAFDRFSKAIYFSGGNLDSSRVNISRCVFLKNDIGVALASGSTLCLIEKSKFYANRMAADLAADKATVRDCWIESIEMSSPANYASTGEEPRPCQIKNSGILHFENNLLVPLDTVPGTIEPAWINNYGSVTVEKTRQGGEAGSFTMVNNFSVNYSLHSGNNAPTSVVIKDSMCYAIYGNVYGAQGGFVYTQPAAVRFINIPNLTVVSNCTGFIDCGLMDYSLYAYHNATDVNTFDADMIADMIAGSGADTSITVIEVTNNSGPYLLARSGVTPASYVPKELYPFVRSNESLWPDRRQPVLPVQSFSRTGNVSTFTYDISGDKFNSNWQKTFLLKFIGNPLSSGSGWYSGGAVGILKINGTSEVGETDFALVYKELFNQIATPASFLSGTFNIEAKWVANGLDRLKYVAGQTNQVFNIVVTGADENTELQLISLDDLG
jgi:hypothetical protein